MIFKLISLKILLILKTTLMLFSLLEEYPDQPAVLEINCVDPLNRSALIAAIENENIELIRLLLEAGIKVKVNNKLFIYYFLVASVLGITS